MNDEEKEWYRQYTSAFGAKEFIRFGCFFFLWMILGFAFVITSGNQLLLILVLITPFIFAIFAPRWKPTYSLLRRILGNNNLPTEPYHGSFIIWQRRPWWSYLPGLWFTLLSLILLYIILKK